MLRVELDHEEDAIIAEMGRMIYKSPQVRWHMTIPGEGFLDKLSGSMKRRMVGEIAMQCQFSGPGEVGFGGSAQCAIISVELVSGQSITAQRGAFLASAPAVGIGMAAGRFLQFDLQADEEVSTEIGSMVYHEATVEYTVRRAAGLRAAILGGEGIVLAHFLGPGRASLQTMAHWAPAVRAARK